VAVVVPVSVPIRGSSFGRPLDHRLSLPSLPHRNNPRSLTFHTLRATQQVIITHTNQNLVMRTLTHLSFSSFLVLALSLTPTVSSASTGYRRELSIVGSDFFEQFNWESENDPTHGRVNYLTLEQAKAKNLSYGLLSLLRLTENALTDTISYR